MLYAIALVTLVGGLAQFVAVRRAGAVASLGLGLVDIIAAIALSVSGVSVSGSPFVAIPLIVVGVVVATAGVAASAKVVDVERAAARR